MQTHLIVLMQGQVSARVQCPMFKENEWHHLAGIYNGNTTALYIDGKQTAEQKSTGKMVPSTGPLFIGTKHPNASEGDYWNGLIDEIAVWNSALSANAVAAIYNSGSGLDALSNTGDYTSSSNLVTYLQMQSNVNSTTGNNHGTFEGYGTGDYINTLLE